MISEMHQYWKKVKSINLTEGTLNKAEFREQPNNLRQYSNLAQ